MKFGPLTKKLQAQTLTHPKSTMRVLCMLLHLSSSHVTLLPGGIRPPIFFPIKLTAQCGLTLGFGPNFQFEVSFT